MFEFISLIFKLQDAMRKKILKNQDKLKVFKKVYFFSLLAFLLYGIFIMRLDFNIYIKNSIFLAICAINLISNFISNLKDMCTSISGFLKLSIFTTIILGSIIYFMFANYIVDEYLAYGMIVLIFTIIWSFLSTLSEAKVGKFANTIVAVVVGILLQTNSFIWSILELTRTDINFEMPPNELNLTSYKIMELSINTVLFPFFVMAAVGALACAYKEYWKEKKEELEKR